MIDCTLHAARRASSNGKRTQHAAAAAQEIDWTRPTAIVFGNEKDGVSAAALAAADRSVVIPMSGFAQSVNISVAAAVVLYEAREARMRAQGRHASLTPAQQRVLTAIMMMRSQARHRARFMPC